MPETPAAKPQQQYRIDGWLWQCGYFFRAECRDPRSVSGWHPIRMGAPWPRDDLKWQSQCEPYRSVDRLWKQYQLDYFIEQWERTDIFVLLQPKYGMGLLQRPVEYWQCDLSSIQRAIAQTEQSIRNVWYWEIELHPQCALHNSPIQSKTVHRL